MFKAKGGCGWLATWGTIAGAASRPVVDDRARLGGSAPAGGSADALGARGCAAAPTAEIEAAQQGAAVRQLVRLTGVATTSAAILLYDEGLLWRAFRNRREIGGLLVCANAV